MCNVKIFHFLFHSFLWKKNMKTENVSAKLWVIKKKKKKWYGCDSRFKNIVECYIYLFYLAFFLFSFTTFVSLEQWFPNFLWASICLRLTKFCDKKYFTVWMDGTLTLRQFVDPSHYNNTLYKAKISMLKSYSIPLFILGLMYAIISNPWHFQLWFIIGMCIL